MPTSSWIDDLHKAGMKETGLLVVDEILRRINEESPWDYSVDIVPVEDDGGAVITVMAEFSNSPEDDAEEGARELMIVVPDDGSRRYFVGTESDIKYTGLIIDDYGLSNLVDWLFCLTSILNTEGLLLPQVSAKSD